MEKKEAGVRESNCRIGVVLLCSVLAVAFSVNAPRNALGAAKYPTSSVDLIVPFAAGGSTDVLGRLLAAELSKKWGKTVTVVDKPGGGCVIGTQAVMSAAPDGYTLLIDGPGSSSGQMGVSGLPYEVSNRTFLARIFLVPLVFITSTKAPWNTLQELAEAGRKDPASVVWGAAGGGRSSSDFVLLHFLDEAGIDPSKARKVDFGGTGTALNALAGEHIKLHVATPAVITPLVSSGKARALGITSPKRSPILPDCPTTREAGFPAVNYQWWVGVSGPAGLPAEVQETIVKTIEEISRDAALAQRLDKDFNATMGFLRPDAFQKFVQDEGSRILRLIKLMQGSR